MKRHYLVYQITNLINGKIYIGIHSTENIEDGYMGSGTHIRRAVKKYGINNFEKQILFDFDNPEEMIEKEKELVDRKFIARKDVYNIKLGGEGWLTIDSVSVKDVDGNCFRVHNTDERWINGELKAVSHGMVMVKDIHGNKIRVSIDDPRYLNGELKHTLTDMFKGFASVKDNLGNIFKVKLDDPRYLNGELVGSSKGFKHSNKTKQMIGMINSVHQKGDGNSQFGTCWIHNIEMKENKKIKKIELNSFLSEGWIKGRKMNF